MSVDTLIKIAKGLNVSTDKLLFSEAAKEYTEAGEFLKEMQRLVDQEHFSKYLEMMKADRRVKNMEAFRQHKQEEKRYQLTLLRFGRVTVRAKSQSEAIQKANRLNETEIQWLSETDGIPGGRLVSLVFYQEILIIL